MSNPAAKEGPPITFGTPLASLTNPQVFGSAPKCPAQLLPKKECQLKVLFFPDSPGPQSATLTIHDNAVNADQVIQLEGTGK